MPRRPVLRVLAYHAVADLAGARVLEPYGVPPDAFRRQLDLLQRLGFHFVGADEFLAYLHGRRGLPRRAILLTFDDCYEDLLHTALPLLEERSIPAVAFAVSGLPGGTNAWDEAIGAPRLRLLDGDGLLKLERRGMEIGAHSRTHPFLTRLPDEELSEEVGAAVAELEALGLRRPRLFAYPYGDSDPRVERAAAAAGLQAAFTVTPGRVRPGDDPYRLPRFEIVRGDTGCKFLLKLVADRRAAVLLSRLRSKLRRSGQRLGTKIGRP